MSEKLGKYILAYPNCQKKKKKENATDLFVKNCTKEYF